MLISFVIPVYNNSDEFAECLQSLQPLLDGGVADVVAVDDGSEVPLVCDVAGVRVVRVPHRGAAAARNIGIEAAQGDFIWPVDADDILVTDGIGLLVDALKTMPDTVPLFHIGDMLTQTQAGVVPPNLVPLASATQRVAALQLVAPRSSIIDHTTNIVRRCWLMADPTLRYPENMSLLEDSVFCLKVAEKAGVCFSNSTFRFYCHRVYHPSTTAGLWPHELSERFAADICSFFVFLKDYAGRHSSDSDALRLYERMRYVYLRVMMVKGCRRSDVEKFIGVVGRPRRMPLWLYFFIAFLCRTLRPKR